MFVIERKCFKGMVSIREMKLSDFESANKIYFEIDELHRIAHPELFKKTDDKGRTTEYIKNLFDNENAKVFVAEINDELVGLAECYIKEAPDYPILQQRKWVLIDSIAVIESHRGKGIGKLLFERIKNWASENGVKRIELKVYSFNKNAMKFYEGLGFEELTKHLFLET